MPSSTRWQAEPDKVYPVKLGDKTINASLKDIIYDAPKGDFHHPNTMTVKLLAGDKVLLEQEYYSVGGGFIEWKGYQPPKKNPPKYPYSTMAEVLALHQARQDLARPARLCQRARDLRPRQGGDQRLPRQDPRRDARDGEDRARRADGDLARADQAQDQGRRRLSRTRMNEPGAGAQGDRPGFGGGARRIGRECARPPRDHRADRRVGGRDAGGHLFARCQTARRCPTRSCAKRCLPPRSSAICASTTRRSSAAEGGCQAEIGVASAMGAAAIAQAHDAPPQIAANAAGAALEHHLGMTCDPVAGFVQVPCIERCAFGAVKSWTGYLIAKQRDPGQPPRRFRFT